MGGSVTIRWLLIGAAFSALIGGVAYSIVHSQVRAREGIEAEFGRRATLAAQLTGGAIASGSAQMKATFSGPDREIPKVLRKWESTNPDPQAVVLDGTGRLLAAWPDAAGARSLQRRPEVRTALSGRMSISDVHRLAGDADPMITIASPIDTPHGRRVVAYTTTATVLEEFADVYLAGAPAVHGAAAHIVDGTGAVLASSEDVPTGRPLPDAALAREIRRRAAGTLGSRYFTTASLPRTQWRVVFAAPRARLMAPVEGSTQWMPWWLFAAFVVTLLGLLAVARSVLRTSAQLSAARTSERAARHLAHERLHDSLTGLPNRALFLDRTQHALARAARASGTVGVLFLDLDRFKRINDSLGHSAGDQLLILVGTRLRQAVRPEDTVSRFGGDEFLVLCDGIAGDEIAIVADRLRAALAKPFVIAGREIHVDCCIGIAVSSPGDGVDAAQLIHDADVAMDRAKHAGPGQTSMFDLTLHDEAARRLDLEIALRDAIGAGELFLHYQPILDMESRQLRAVEALVRWQRPGVGVVPPLEFIGLAEETGLISELGGWVLERVMTDMAALAREKRLPPDFAVSVNVSPRQLEDGDFAQLLADRLAMWTLPAETLWLEVTESAVAREPEVMEAALRSLHSLGVRVALDDFGVGQTSLQQLTDTLPADVLKLDRSFVMRIDDPRSRNVVAAMPALAQAVGMTLVAEGIETEQQAADLQAAGYPLGQGYHLGRPMAIDALRERLDAAAPPVRAR